MVKRSAEHNRAEIDIKIDNESFVFNFVANSEQVKIEKSIQLDIPNSLYLPPREIISIFEGFVSLYQNREINFDETYYQLAIALGVPMLRGKRFEEIQNLIKPLEEITESKIIKENGRFYLQNQQGKMEMPLVAEGYRKIATLMYLIANGELFQNSIFFWDEPESNLNPKLTKKVVELLIILAQKGVQIFLASHDYLLTNLLSLHGEYQAILPQVMPSIQFFGLYEQEENLVFDKGNTLIELSQNPILEEFAAFYDLEQRYFNQSIQTKVCNIQNGGLEGVNATFLPNT